ncbi:MAG: succinate dehydrogenase cytochrome b subunit [Chloroflexi bacterium]|nr:succinate dehydrogenase cytochrome b subunit [Chloroflexota bacterium]
MAQASPRSTVEAAVKPISRRPGSGAPWPLNLYASAVGKKWVMAVTGVIGMGFVTMHMLGNLKMYMGAEDLNHYAEGLRTIGAPIAPEQSILWILRVVLLVALVLHVHAAFSLWSANRRARPVAYASQRDYIAANWASRTMKWTGPIVLLFIFFHLMDLTWGPANPGFVYGDVYGNVVASFSRLPVVIVYIVANVALGIHLWHGAWSLFQSLGVNNPYLNALRRGFATVFALAIVGGNVSFPIAVYLGIVS